MPPRRSKRKRDTSATAASSDAAAAAAADGSSANQDATNAASSAAAAAASSSAAAAAGSTAAATAATGASRQSTTSEKKPKSKKKKKEKSSKPLKASAASKLPPDFHFSSISNYTLPQQDLATTIVLSQNSLLSKLVLQIQSLSKSKGRCTAALQALLDGRVAYTTVDDYVGGLGDSGSRASNSAGGSKGGKKKVLHKSTDFAPNLAAFAAALAGDDAYFDTLPHATTTTTSTTTIANNASTTATTKGKNKKVKQGKRKGGENAASATSATTGSSSLSAAAVSAAVFAAAGIGIGDGGIGFGGNGDGDAITASNQKGSQDAHLLMAVTQAVNVLLAFLKDQQQQQQAANAANATKANDAKMADSNASKNDSPGMKRKESKKSKKKSPPPKEEVTQDNQDKHDLHTSGTAHTANQEAIKNAAITLISLSHPLVTSLVNDRTLLETITKASRNPHAAASPSSSRGMGGTSFFSHDTDDDELYGGGGGGGGSGGGGGGGGYHGQSNPYARRGYSPDRTSIGARGGAGTGGGGSSSSAEYAKRIVISHAKAVVGRALTSGVMGALWGMEALGRLKHLDGNDVNVGNDAAGTANVAGKESESVDIQVVEEKKKAASKADPKVDSGKDDDDEDKDDKEDNKDAKEDKKATTVASSIDEAQRTILRKSLWSALLTLETAFQLTSKPKLLVTSSVCSPTSNPANSSSGGGGNSGGGGGGHSGGNNSGSSFSQSAMGVGGGTTGGLADFENLLSAAAMMGTGGGSNGGGVGGGVGGGGAITGMMGGAGSSSAMSSLASLQAGHAHLAMGAETIGMWNGLLGRILMDCKVEFQHAKSVTAMATAEEGEDGSDSKEARENDHLAQICHDVTEALFEDEIDSKLISLVLEGAEKKPMEGISSPGGGSTEPPKKTRRTASTSTASRSRKTNKGSKQPPPPPPPQPNTHSPSHEDYSHLSALLSDRPENRVTFDCHVSIRRWAVLAFGWLCSGQKRLLETGVELLMRADVWGGIMELAAGAESGSGGGLPLAAAAAVGGEVPVASKKKKKLKAKFREERDPLDTIGSRGVTAEAVALEAVPGNLALVAFVSATIDTIYDAGATGGLSPPSSGWMDDYVKAVVGVPPEAAATDEAEEAPAKDPAPAPAAAKEAEAAVEPAPAAGVRRSTRKRSKATKSNTANESNNTGARAKKSPSSTTGGSGTPSRAGAGGSGGSPGKKGSPPSVWIRPDVRDETAVLTRWLMERHLECMQDIFSKDVVSSITTTSTNGGLILANDDDSFRGSGLSPSSSSRRRAMASGGPKEATGGGMKSYYPFMHKTLETLGRTAASSSFFASSDGKGRVMAIGAAITLGCFSRGYEEWLRSRKEEEGDGSAATVVVLDAKLLSMAVSQLSECLDGILLLGARVTASAGAMSASSSSSSAALSIPQDVLTTYHLNEPLGISMENVTIPPATATGKQQVGSASSMDGRHAGNPFSSYGGAFAPLPEDEAQPTAAGEVRPFRSASSSSSQKKSSAEILSLFVRALIEPPSEGSNSVAAAAFTTATSPNYQDGMSLLLKSLLGIVRACYDFQPEAHSSASTAAISETSSKKKAPSKKKKRKAGEFASSVLETTGVVGGLGARQESLARKTYTRSVLASDALHVLVQLLASGPEKADGGSYSRTMATSSLSSDNKNDSAALCIRSYFCKCLSTTMVLDFVNLGYLLEDKLVGSRLDTTRQEFIAALTATAAAGMGSGTSGLNNMLDVTRVFELWERQLWVCHVQLALAIGRGGGDRPPSSLGDAATKSEGNSRLLQVYHAIVEAEKEQKTQSSSSGGKQPAAAMSKKEKKLSSKASKKPEKFAFASPSDTKDLWPLCLPAVQHALFSAMVLSSAPVVADIMTDDPRPKQQELLFFCHAFLNSVAEHVGNISPTPTSELEMVSVSDYALISLRDARLFAFSVSQLSRDDRVDILHKTLTALGSINSALDASSSHLLARAITLCVCLVDVVSSPDLGQLLRAELEATNYSIPRLERQQSQQQFTLSQPPVLSKEFYQSLFGNWQSPSVPASAVTTTEMVLEGTRWYKELEGVITSALTAGFNSSTHDGCHLLFSAYNAAAKLTSWTSLGWESPASATAIKKMGCPEDRMIRLREDICSLHELMTARDGYTPSQQWEETLLSRVVRSKPPRCRPNEALLSGLEAAEKMLSFVTLEVSKKKSQQSGAPTAFPTLPMFAYYEALPVYVSFLMSIHCRPGSNDLGWMHRFQMSKSSQLSSSSLHRGSRAGISSSSAASYRNYSDESDIERSAAEDSGPNNSDGLGNGNRVLRSNALMRLHEATSAIGAAPCHPDWLDVNCRLRDDLIPSIAVDNADRALLALTKFGEKVLKSYFEAMLHVLGTMDEQPLDEDGDSAMQEGTGMPTEKMMHSVALQLFFAQQQHPSDISEPFYEQVAAVSGNDRMSSIFKLLINSISSTQDLSGSNFLSTSAQRVKGADNVSKKSWKVLPGEHRANGRWETLLSEVLRGSSLSGVPSTAIESALREGGTSNDAVNQQRIADAMVSVHHWRRVLYSVINAMVPTAALLRFGINDGKGRPTHTLCEELPGSIFSSSSDSTSTSRFSTENNEVGATIQKALSFLSCVSAYSSNDEDMRLTSRSAAGHLLENNTSAHFNDLVSLWVARISCEAMDGLVQILTAANDDKSLTEDQRSSASSIIESTLTQYAEDAGDEVDDINGMPILTMDDSLDHDKRKTLLACLGLRNLKVGHWIGQRSAGMELKDMLSNYGYSMDPFCLRKNEDSAFGWGPSMQRDVAKLLLMLMCGKVPLHVRARIFVAEMLIDLMDAEIEMIKGNNKAHGGNGAVRLSAAAALDELSNEDVLLLFNNLVYATEPEESGSHDDLLCEERKCLSEKTAIAISYLASVSSGEETSCGDRCKIILDEILKCLDVESGSSSSQSQHLQQQHQRHMIKLLCLLASRFGALDEAGRMIVSVLQQNERKKKDGKRGKGDTVMTREGYYVEMAKDFFEFVASLDQLVHHKSTATDITQVAKTTEITEARGSETSSSSRHGISSSGNCVTLKNGEEVPRTCSFVETGEGFTEQHWYNCYTCGLLWDKGCCSLCARVCHQGHDIGYSRKSSFFCDCGAEVATAIEQNRTPCKCLTPVAEDTIRELYEDESDDTNEVESTTQQQPRAVSDIFTQLIVKNFPSQCKGSLQKLVEAATKSEWNESILDLFNQFYKTTTESPGSSGTDFASLFSDTPPRPITGAGHPNLESRSGEPLELKRLNESAMLPLRAAKASALQSRMISSSSSSHIRKSRNESHVQTIAADNRGRLYIAESSSVIFCSAIPSVNVRHVENSQASHLSRSQLNLLGSDTVKFPINGMAICSENNRHLLVWGSSKACVAVISKSFDSFESVIELKLNLEPSEECEYLVKCDWIPQSELQIVAVCGTVVHVFDLNRTENSSCNATTHYALAYEDVLIRSATLIGSLSVEDGSAIETKLALLLDTGRLYFISLTIDEEGNLEDHGESYIEIGAGLSFPSAGIRRYVGGEPVPKGSTATTFGEGVFLAYLPMSNLLLYQCVTSCCIAMLLDPQDGTIRGSFELLPNMISAEDLGGHYGVSGPYTHFQELGIVRRGEESFFRVSCVGRSTRSTQPRALVLEFNENSVSVKELVWPTNCSAGLGFISSYNFVGSCTFSCPCIVGSGATSGNINDGTQVYERAVLTLLSSSGSLLFFGEDCDAGNSTNFMSHCGQHQAPAIGTFEKMINVSELDELVYGGDFVGKDPKSIKRKLSLNCTDYVISPSHGGSTITASITTKSVADSKSREVDENALAIVAVRILVGSMPDLIPREIIVMGSGRSIKLKRNMKRWYDFTLTDEEILLTLRNGFVTIWISSCHESSSTPIIDSVEVYAKPRTDLAFLDPDLHHGGTSGEEFLPTSTRSICLKEEPSSDLLVSCIQSLTFLTQIMGHNNMGSLSVGSRDTISQIIQQTALDGSRMGTLREQTIEFLTEAEGDVAKRTFLIDDATLRGLMSVLQGLGRYLRSEFANVDLVSPKQEAVINRAIGMLINIFASAINIAQKRGGNYRRVISEMIAEESCQATISIALEGKKLLDFCQYLKALHGANLKLNQPAQLVSQLILMEIACSDSKEFAQFDTLAEYLMVDSTEIVKASCSAIFDAIGESNKKISNTSPEKELASETGIITYQCDACLVFPITGRRYTLGGEMDIDLCRQCYDLGISYSRTHDQNDPVIINGRTLCVENEDMTCGKIWQMTSKPIAASSLEQAENAKKAGLLNNMTGAAKEPALNRSAESPIQYMDISGSQKEDIDVVRSEGFRSQIFTQLLGLMTNSLDVNKGSEETSPPSSHVLQLVLGIVLGSCTEELKVARGKEMAAAFTKNLSALVKACQSNESSFSKHCCKLNICLRTLASLVMQKKEMSCAPPSVATAEEENARAHHNHKDKTDPRFICDVHGVPAVRRRCSHGVHKDRRFYVCGLERSQRCNYFKWSSDIPEIATKAEGKGKDGNQMFNRDDVHNIFVPVQMELQKIFSEDGLQAQFCSLVSDQFENQSVATVPEVTINEGTSGAKFPSIKTELEKTQDMNDGVYKLLEKFGKSKPMPSHLNDNDFPSSITANGTKESFLCASLDLFSLLAPKRKSSSDIADTPPWTADWFSVLCQIISTGSSVLRHFAKSMLQRLCGGRQDIYHRVRDHYVFGFQFRKLLQRSQDILDSALVVREQARQCGSDWREDEVMFDTLAASGLLGVEDLISEDCYAILTEESISTVLDELLSAAGRGVGLATKARSNNWRQFCGLPEMAIPIKKGTSIDNQGEIFEMLEQIYHRPPIVSLMWLSSCLRGPNQVKALTLTDIALDDMNSSTVKFQRDDVDDDDLLVGGYQTSDCPSDPEQCLLKCFSVDDLLSFITQFVLHGRSKDLQCVANSVARKLALRLSSAEKKRLFSCLIGGPFQQVGSLGNASNYLLDLISLFVECFGPELDLSNVSSCIASSFMSQMTVLNHYYGPNQGLFGKNNDTDSGGLSCNLSNCVHCQKQTSPKKAPKSGNKKSDNSSQNNASAAGFLPEQVRPYQRGRLEASTATNVSSEFSTYHQLKFRVALSQVHITVTDPRGRLVKTIGVYFSPRQVSDASILKSAKYNHLWQRCGTLSLARGGTEATCKLKHPVIAANLKFTYEEFYEKASNKRAADGSFILYCPRCTRQVHNAHGVCGNCGEVAFQCRKCRHINYDRLDAFLCVECGYCTAGGFSYEITAGIALNAIAILDEDGFQRSMAMLRIANKRQADLRNSLKKKVMVAMQHQRKLRGNQENLDEMVLYGPHLKRALLGGMPKSEGFDEDEDSSKKSSGASRAKSSSASDRASSTSNRARSLLSLARSLRAEGGDGFGSRGDFLRQALLSAGSSGPSGFDSLEDTDLLSALSASGVASSSSDPLSRIVANIHARARDEGRSSRASGAGGGGGSGGKQDGSRKDDKSKLSPSEERHRIYTQMREAERECYELNRRIDAWNRLNKDCLAGSSVQTQYISNPNSFMPSTCSTCSMQMAYQVLSLLHAVYITNISQSDHTVNSDLIKILFKESQSPPSEFLCPKLKDLKRRVIITLASSSDVASKMILTELKSRLAAVQDVTSAEILGKLVELDFPMVDEYIELAMTTLSNLQGDN